MSEKLPRSSQPRLQRTLHRRQFFAITDAVSQPAAINASGVNSSQGKQQSRTLGLLEMDQIQTSASLPVIQSTGNGSNGHRQFLRPSPLHPEKSQMITPLPAIQSNGSHEQRQAQAPATPFSKEIATHCPTSCNRKEEWRFFYTR